MAMSRFIHESRSDVRAHALLMSVLLCFGLATLGRAQECRITIDSPKKGDKVGLTVRVSGKATVPPGGHLWVLAHREDLDYQWWPQGAGPARLRGDRGDEWRVTAYLGGPQDIGDDFEIAAVIVGEQTNKDLQAWFDRSQRTERYPPIRFPQALEGCAPERVIVKKQSH